MAGIDKIKIGSTTYNISPSWNNIRDTPVTYPPDSHNHNNIYYTKSEMDNELNGKSDTGHTHTYLSNVAVIGGENTSNHPWRRIMSIPSTTNNFVDVVGTYYLSSNYYGGPYYLFRVEFRTNNSTNGDLGNFEITVIATNDEPYHLAIASYSVFSNKVTESYSDIFVKVKSYPRMTLTRLSAMDFGTIHYYDSYENSGATIRTEAYTAINGSETGCASYELHSLSKYTYVHEGQFFSSKIGFANNAGSVLWAGIRNKPSTFPPDSHNHDDRYYTESEMDSKLNGKANSSHTHSYLPLSGGTLTGALNFNNNTWNLVGDDVYIGDYNQGGSLGIKGKNGQTNIGFVNQSNDYYIKLASPGVTANRTITMPDDSGTIALTKNIPTSLPPSSHTHDDRYYTESEINDKLNNYLPLNGTSPMTGALDLSSSSNGIQFSKTTNGTPYYVTNIEAGSKTFNINNSSGSTGTITVTFNNYRKGQGSWYVVANASDPGGTDPSSVTVAISSIGSSGCTIKVRRNTSASGNPAVEIYWIAIKYY